MNNREDFEKWISTRKLCIKYGAKLDRFVDGQYRDIRVRGHFSTWQAARATPALPQPADNPAACGVRGRHGWQSDPCAKQVLPGSDFCAEHSEKPQALPQGVEEVACSPTKGMNLGERIAHVGGRENEAGYIEFGSVMAVDALINHVLRDIRLSAKDQS